MKKLIWIACFGIGSVAGLFFSVVKNLDFFIVKALEKISSYQAIVAIGALYAAWFHETIATKSGLIQLGVLLFCLCLLHGVSRGLDKNVKLK